jgi:hypothetical protein
VSPPSKMPPSHGERHSNSPSPPVPPYNPTQPDKFPLSNKKDYRLEYKQQRHSYESVDKEAVRSLQRNFESGSVAAPVEGRGGVAGHAAALPVRKKHQGGVVASSETGGGHVKQNHAPTGGSVRSEIGRIQARGEAELADLPITDLASVEVACSGLPSSGMKCI